MRSFFHTPGYAERRGKSGAKKKRNNHVHRQERRIDQRKNEKKKKEDVVTLRDTKKEEESPTHSLTNRHTAIKARGKKVVVNHIMQGEKEIDRYWTAFCFAQK